MQINQERKIISNHFTGTQSQVCGIYHALCFKSLQLGVGLQWNIFREDIENEITKPLRILPWIDG